MDTIKSSSQLHITWNFGDHTQSMYLNDVNNADEPDDVRTAVQNYRAYAVANQIFVSKIDGSTITDTDTAIKTCYIHQAQDTYLDLSLS